MAGVRYRVFQKKVTTLNMDKNWTIPRINSCDTFLKRESYAILYKCKMILIDYLYFKLFENNVLYRKTYFCG